MDLAALDTKQASEEGVEFQLTHPQTGEVLPVWIKVCGSDSERFQGFLREQQRRRMERLNRNRRKTITPEEIEDESLDLLAHVTVGWRCEASLDGRSFPEFSTPAAKELYRRFRWIREQVDTHMGDRANFLPK